MIAEQFPTPPSLPSKSASLSEHAAFFDTHPELITPDYLNNFYVRFGRSLVEAMGGDDSGEGRLDASELNSALRAGQTDGEFRAVVDSAIGEAGLDLNSMKSLQSQVYEFSLNRDLSGGEILLRELLSKLVPTYLLLRGKGYSHYDLVQ